MPNTTSGTATFDKTFAIDDIIEESFQRIGFDNITGYQMKSARRSMNIMFQEWGNRGLHYWEIGELDLDFQTGDQVVYECTLLGAFPTTVNAIELSDGSNNQVIELSISLAYRRWRSSGATSNRDALGSIFNTIGLPDIRKVKWGLYSIHTYTFLPELALTPLLEVCMK